MNTESNNTFAPVVDAIQKLAESLTPAGFDVVEIESAKTAQDEELNEGVYLTVRLKIDLPSLRT